MCNFLLHLIQSAMNTMHYLTRIRFPLILRKIHFALDDQVHFRGICIVMWAHQVHMYSYAHNSQPFSALNVFPQEIVFHTRRRIPLTFDLNLNRNTRSCICQYWFSLTKHSHYDKTHLNPFFYRTLSKLLPQ